MSGWNTPADAGQTLGDHKTWTAGIDGLLAKCRVVYVLHEVVDVSAILWNMYSHTWCGCEIFMFSFWIYIVNTEWQYRWLCSLIQMLRFSYCLCTNTQRKTKRTPNLWDILMIWLVELMALWARRAHKFRIRQTTLPLRGSAQSFHATEMILLPLR